MTGNFSSLCAYFPVPLMQSNCTVVREATIATMSLQIICFVLIKRARITSCRTSDPFLGLFFGKQMKFPWHQTMDCPVCISAFVQDIWMVTKQLISAIPLTFTVYVWVYKYQAWIVRGELMQSSRELCWWWSLCSHLLCPGKSSGSLLLAKYSRRTQSRAIDLSLVFSSSLKLCLPAVRLPSPWPVC